MRTTKREYLLIAAFMLCVVFIYAMRAYLNIAAGSGKIAQILAWNVAGTLAGALVLPLLLPLAYLKPGNSGVPAARISDKRGLSRTARLVLTALLFLPGTITGFLIPVDVYLTNNGISAFAAFGNGTGFTLITGCFYLLVNNKRTLWAVLSTIIGISVFYLIQGGGSNLPLPIVYTGIGLVSVIGGIFILVFLVRVPKNEQLENSISTPPVGNGVADRLNRRIPRFLFPFLAVFIIFLTGSITDRLFLPSLNYPFDSGFNPFVVTLLFILTLFGFLAARQWGRFLRLFIYLCAGLFAIYPSLLFFNRSETIFMVLYTLNITATRMITVVFPFVLMDLYRQDIAFKDAAKGGKPRSGYLVWFMAISVFSINVVSIVLGNLLNNLRFDNAYAVLILSLAAVAFFILCSKVLPKNKETAEPSLNAVNPSVDDILREHNLSERETEVALLMVREGLSDKEMGERLFISPYTVRDHVTSVYRKFEVKNRAGFLEKVYNK